MNEFFQDNVLSVVEGVWSESLEIAVEPGPSSLNSGSGTFFTGSIRIAGTWNGVVELLCHESAAQQAMRAMFANSGEEADQEELGDVVAELTNMTGGSLKAMLPDDCDLELPAVRIGAPDSGPIGVDRVAEHGFLCGGSPVVVRVFERRNAPAAH